jgi:hypothetical protein
MPGLGAGVEAKVKAREKEREMMVGLTCGQCAESGSSAG